MARKRKSDAKEAALAETRTLNPRPEAVRDEQFGVVGVLRRPGSGAGQIRDGAPGAGGRGTRWRGPAAAFGFSRPSYYEAAAAVDRDGLGGLVPARPGPRRAHKLTDEVVAYVQQLREQDPTVGSARLAAAIAEKFAIRVHPRSVERALARARQPQKWRRAMTFMSAS